MPYPMESTGTLLDVKMTRNGVLVFGADMNAAVSFSKAEENNKCQ